MNNMSNYLKNRKVYISSPIENGFQDDWRFSVTQSLKDRFGLDVFDPTKDPKQQWLNELKAARVNRDYDRMITIAKSFVRKDLCLVDRADLIIAYLPYKVPTTGTHHEIINSNNAKKPTLLVTDNRDISYLPLWYFGFIPTEFMFGDWSSLFDYLDSVNNGKHKDNNRWAFIYNLI